MYRYEIPLGIIDTDVAILESSEASWRGLKNWSLDDIQDNPTLTTALSKVLRLLNVREAFVPCVARGSGRIVPLTDLTDCVPLVGARLYRNQDLPADGMFLAPGQTFMMSTRGCPLIIAGAGKHFIVAHAGLNSLIDPGAVIGTPTREHVSVVDSIVASFWEQGIPPSKIVMMMLFVTPAIKFERDKALQYSAEDRALAAFVHARWKGGIVEKDREAFLDLETVFIEQALQARVVCASSTLHLPHLARTHDKRSSCERHHLVMVKRNR